MAEPGIVVVGGGQAGGWAAVAARQAGYTGPVTLLAEEPEFPYERPPLSKEALTGGPEGFKGWLRPPEEYATQRIDIRRGVAAGAIDRATASLRLSDGSSLPYHRLILATGAAVRRLAVPGAALDGILYLRSLADCRALHGALAGAEAVCVIGGGFIGLEVAAAARKLGKAVTVLEAAPTLMGRSVPSPIAAHALALHRANGVDVRLGAAVAALEGKGRVEAVVTADGERHPATLVVVGIGVIPRCELAEQAGLEVQDGIVVDTACRTSDPAILACGDVARFAHPRYPKPIRLESWHNAQNQGMAAGRCAAGEEVHYCDVPWVWTDQYDMNLQMVGQQDGVRDWITRGDPAAGKFAMIGLADGVPLYLAAVNAGRDMRPLRKLVENAKLVDPALLADPSSDLRALSA